MLVAQSFQGGDRRYPIRLMLDLEAETDRAFADSLAEGEAKLAEAERAMEALQQAMAALRDAEDAAAAQLLPDRIRRAQVEVGAGAACAGPIGRAETAQGGAGQARLARCGRARAERAARAAHRAAVPGCKSSRPPMQAAEGLGSQLGGTGEQLRTPAAWVRPSRALGARSTCRCGGACALGPCGPRLFGQPPGRPPGG